MTKHNSPLLGFNNNVRHKGRVFHIQTEDSGVRHPHVITHLFMDGGRILKTTKTSYTEHVGTEGYATIVRDLMKQQHKAMFVALREGAFDAQISKTAGPAVDVVVAPAPVRAAEHAEEAVAERFTDPPPPPSVEIPADVPPSEPPMDIDLAAIQRAATAAASDEGRSSSPRMAISDLPPPPPNVFRQTSRDAGAYNQGSGEEVRITPPPSSRTTPRPVSPSQRSAARPAGQSIRPSEKPPSGRSPAPPPRTPSRTPAPPVRTSDRVPVKRPTRVSQPPPAPPRYGVSRPSASGARATEGRSIFGEELISEKSLDEVILSYLAEDLDGSPSKK